MHAPSVSNDRFLSCCIALQSLEELNGNNLTRITKSDFAGLKYLRVLQLMENQITVIERGAFDDMKELERLRLNRNQLQQLPELLFQKNPGLSRL
ncbi:hypothetical protein GOODEAATRI_011081 [Goodea atripinnis]|uniref:Uncharacterized protein n=1 Tax=Goodea atripinnis TaxID=208336 RepID=A0ABV0PXU8_9TELE